MASISFINNSTSFPSTSIIKCAATLSSMTIVSLPKNSLTILSASASTNSSALGVNPALNIALTAAPACSRLLNGTSINRSTCGCGISFKTIFVTMQRVPSLPTTNCVRLYPVEFFKTFAPVHIISPLGKTISRLITKSLTTPYFTALGPPLFSAMLPPMKQLPLLLGSGG